MWCKTKRQEQRARAKAATPSIPDPVCPGGYLLQVRPEVGRETTEYLDLGTFYPVTVCAKRRNLLESKDGACKWDGGC